MSKANHIYQYCNANLFAFRLRFKTKKDARLDPIIPTKLMDSQLFPEAIGTYILQKTIETAITTLAGRSPRTIGRVFLPDALSPSKSRKS